MKIRKLDIAERDELASFWRKAFPDDPSHNDPVKVIAEKLAVDDLIFVAEENNIIIGACMAGYDGHRGWLYAVAIEHKLRRKGIGKELVTFAIACLKELGCGKVNLQIRKGNEQAEDFYKSLGFITEERISMGIRFEE
ncbi:MAG: ribosomal protein S18 acetylase RimI-like enzyme [Planctomycetota bacterium]|jgi:ribosomal protein S18 acetylase RimI-like enzyme